MNDLYTVREDGSDLRLVTHLGYWGRDPAWSTRNWIAFTRYSFASHAMRPDIWMVRPDGGDLHAVTRAGGTSAAWTPSGRTLAYVCDRWLCTLRPGGRRRLIVRSGTHPAWSPDAHRIALVGRNGTYTARPDGSRLHMILRKRPSLCNFSITTRGCLPGSLDWQPLPRR